MIIRTTASKTGSLTASAVLKRCRAGASGPVLGLSSVGRRSIFYMGGDAHLHAAPIYTSDYIFQRPPDSSTSAAAAAMPQSLESSYGATAATAAYYPATNTMGGGAAAAAVATAGVGSNTSVVLGSSNYGGWEGGAYHSEEFAPWEDILLDATAWMIAIVLCYDPTRGRDLEHLEDDELQEEAERQKRNNRKASSSSSSSSSASQHHGKEDPDKHRGN
mmetsp:Transcript_9873/g.17484  ORF Transcript_9873/g.17484 Transcript_9873/m.17484 type:complete len:218 (+) Transcript_9873:192-845(+)